jgi:capsule polysaccharide export protein KpsC/LpsZ
MMASVLCGGGPKGDNLSLLKPLGAPIQTPLFLYKPHPDVESNLRRGALPKKPFCAMPMIASKIVAQRRPLEL